MLHAAAPLARAAELVQAFEADTVEQHDTGVVLDAGGGVLLDVRDSGASTPGLAALWFSAPEPGAARAALIEAGATDAPTSAPSTLSVELHGAAIVLTADAPARRPDRPRRCRLHHVDVLCSDLDAARRAVERGLGLRTLLECSDGGGGWAFLADSGYPDHGVLLEIMGPPHLDRRQELLLADRGPCLDHLCFQEDPIEAAWTRTLAAGLVPDEPPSAYAGTTIAWLKNADGLDIELVGALDESLYGAALRGGPALNIWDETAEAAARS